MRTGIILIMEMVLVPITEETIRRIPPIRILNTMNKKESCLQDSPLAAGRLERQLPFRRSAILPSKAYHVTENSNGISCYT